MGKVLNRAELTATEQRKISRVQFDPLTGTPEELWRRWHGLIAYSYQGRPTEIKLLRDLPFLKKDLVTLTWYDMAVICYPHIDEGQMERRGVGFPDYSRNVTESYIRMVCEYVNKVRIKARNEQLQDGAEVDRRLSCVLLLEREIQAISEDSPNTDAEITVGMPPSVSLDKDGILDLDYLFTPSIETRGVHYGLMGIAPKQQFVFVVDSVKSGYTFRVQKMYNILLYLLPGNVDDKKQEAEANWNVFGQWSRRENKKTDGSPNCCVQGDYYNCGNFTLTNAMCLAFGFDLLCYQQDDLNEKKRPRIAAEFDNEGFLGEFAYDMFDLPIGKADRLTKPQPKKADPPTSPSEEVVHAFDNPRKRKYKARPRFDKAGHGDIRSAADALAYEQQLPEDLRPKPRMPESYPPQFDSKVFGQAGFLYATPQSINYNPKRDYSLDELKDACRNFPLEGWEEWCTRPKEIFTKWMLNEMGAFMSLARGDPLEPMEGLAPGYENWKKEQDAAHGLRRLPRKCKKVVVLKETPS
ncbi:hypothetical protein N431DRAFT_466050 [Stipitochalara longipes BDJ]|nr:hypothetical protein N431DRAFT_466050 [Stipitochalara longipes BDJ]